MNSKFSAVKVVFFDTSDTLYQNDALEAAYPRKLVELVAAARGVSVEDAKELIRQTAASLEGQVKHVTKVRVASELGFSRNEVHEKAFCLVDPSQYLVKDEALNRLMSDLAKKYKLGIISNLRRSHMMEVFAAMGLSPDVFTYFVTEDIVHEIKPDHEPFLKSIELSGCAPQECLYVGDSPTKDIRPAKEVGMKTVLIAAHPTEAESMNSDAQIATLSELKGLL
jgi:putative hydrolase of the HAD superfamily